MQQVPEKVSRAMLMRVEGGSQLESRLLQLEGALVAVKVWKLLLADGQSPGLYQSLRTPKMKKTRTKTKMKTPQMKIARPAAEVRPGWVLHPQSWMTTKRTKRIQLAFFSVSGDSFSSDPLVEPWLGGLVDRSKKNKLPCRNAETIDHRGTGRKNQWRSESSFIARLENLLHLNMDSRTIGILGKALLWREIVVFND